MISVREEEDPPISPVYFGGFLLNTFWKETFFTLGLICPSFPLFSEFFVIFSVVSPSIVELTSLP